MERGPVNSPESSIVAVPVEDELMHLPTDDLEFNESMYFSYVDERATHGALLRIGNRVNEGYTEVSVIVYLPGGGLAFRYERLPLTANTWFSAGGLEFELIEPLSQIRVTYRGSALRLGAGTDLEDARTTLKAAPSVPVELDLTFTSRLPLYGLGGSDGSSGLAGGANAVALGHYQGPCHVTGTETVDGVRREIDTPGFRDHSWGPRRWQVQSWWRWISGMTGHDHGFIAWYTHDDKGGTVGTGMIIREGVYHPVDSISVRSSTDDSAPYYPREVDISLRSGSHIMEVHGRVRHFAPLRNTRAGQVARIYESLAEYEFDGRCGYGFAEFQDLIVDGRPSGRGIA
jgi:hypothetical protein